jgi:hypothetical protein
MVCSSNVSQIQGVKLKENKPRWTARLTDLNFLIVTHTATCRTVERVFEMASFNSQTCLTPGEQIVKYSLKYYLESANTARQVQ